ncbi:unnamed protein product [Rhizophagus irregularis]|nr:unnamed protein product [Rhizophagus irregularis]
MLQKPIIVVCSGGLSGLVFALSLAEIFVTKEISGKILLYHEDYKVRNLKNQLYSINETEILRLPQSVRDYVSPAHSMHELEDRLLELIKKLPKETVQLIHERFDPVQTSQDLRFDLLVLADGYNVNLCDSCQFEKEVIFNHYELEINFNLTDNHLQNSEIEILSLFQTRYLIQFQQNNQRVLKINLSKSEFDNIELDPSSNSIKNNPWFMNIIRDGFRFFEINNYDLISISKSSNNSLAVKEFYKNYQHGQNGNFENFVCVIGESAFDCKSWQNKSMNLGIAISTATILAEQFTVEQGVSFEITSSILVKFSNGMLNFQKELMNQFQQKSMDNILSKGIIIKTYSVVIHNIIDNYNKQYPDDQSSIDPSDFMSTLSKYPRLFEIDHTFDYKSTSVLDELKEEYVNNVKISAPEIFFKKLDRIQSMVNYFIIFESRLSSHNPYTKNVESNKDVWVELSQSLILQDFDSNKNLDQKIENDNISDTSSEDSDDSSVGERQFESLSLEEFFQLTFGDEIISYDATNFVTDELTKEIFKVKVKPFLSDPTNGILRNIFPYIVDIINRTIPLQRIQDCIRQISDSKELDDPSQALNRLVNCKGRDYLVAFLDKVPKKALSKTLLSLTRANIPIPLLFTNKNDFNQKGLRILKEIQSLILRDKYHLLLSFNLTTSELTTPFSKKLYPIICKHREDVLEQLYDVNKPKLQEAYKTWILEGEPLQLLDGLSLRSLPTKFLSNVLSNLMTNVERRLIVISVIGLESSGKSTLLNYLFHCGFATSASRCTKGIPGCVDSLEDFMSVEQQDVHLLENAFCCYQDDFRPRVTNIGETENVNLPAEVFPAKISSLRQSLLKSALLHKNASEHFTNVQGFIPYMKTTTQNGLRLKQNLEWN